MESGLYVLLGTFVGGLITYCLQRQRFKQELILKQEEYKTEFMAENTVKHYLSNEKYTDRSFDVLKKHLGGFEEDELRKILVRAGAIRIIGEDGTELWRLLSRMDEYVERKVK